MNSNISFYSVAFVIVVWVIAIFLSAKTNLIKDLSEEDKKPYSFSRTQLLWWSLIIISCYILSCGGICTLPKINETVLVLLGIGLGTTTAARVIDGNQVNNPAVSRHQDLFASKGFIEDILSDENGISIHRFQAVVFNIIFGISFLCYFLQNCAFTTFDEQQLALLGISSGAYIALKINENNANKPVNANP